MPYKDKDKQRAYQRTWVRHKRNGVGYVEPSVKPNVEPDKPELQSYNPMMVGYVPPTE